MMTTRIRNNSVRPVIPGRCWPLLLFLVLALALFAGCRNGSAWEADDPEEAAVEAPGADTLAELYEAGQALDNLYYEVQTTTGTGDVYLLEMWKLHDNDRIEGEIEGHHGVMISDPEIVAVLDPAEERGMITPRAEAEQEPRDMSAAEGELDDFDWPDVEYLGTETVIGHTCHIVSLTDPDQGYTATAWLHADLGIPLKIDYQGDTPERSYLMEVLAFEVGGVTGDRFAIPDHYEILDLRELDLPEIPEGLDDLPEDLDELPEDLEEHLPEDLDLSL